jgi:type II secretory pathway pseudopilin PulG
MRSVHSNNPPGAATVPVVDSRTLQLRDDAVSRGSPPRATAFTLIELVVVLGLIAILSAMILPEMRGTFEDSVLRASGRQFIDVFGLANSRAISLQQTHRVRLDRTGHRYVLERQPGRPSRNAAFVPVNDLSGAEGSIDARISFDLRPPTPAPSAGRGPSGDPDRPVSAGGNAIHFYPDGTADAAELTLRDRAGFGLGLKLNPVTSRVQLTESPRP